MGRQERGRAQRACDVCGDVLRQPPRPCPGPPGMSKVLVSLSRLGKFLSQMLIFLPTLTA